MRHWFRDLPIKWKLTVLNLVVTCSVLLAASVAFFTYDQVSFRKQLVEQVVCTARAVGANTTAALTFRDATVAGKILGTLETQPHVMFAVLYDARDRVLADFRAADIGEDLYPSRVVPSGYHYHGGRLCVFVPVVLETERIGTLCVVHSMRPIYARLGRYASVVLAILGSCTLVAGVLVTHVQSYVSRPITRLKDTAERISAGGDFTLRAEGGGADEIGALVSGFNTMLDQIEVRDSELRGNQEKLRSLASQLLLTEERERRRIAAGMHDSICQLLMVAIMKLRMIGEDLGKDAGETIAMLDEARKLVELALSEARTLTFQLSPPGLYEVGLAEALGRLTEQMAAQYGMNIRYDDDKRERELGEDVSVFLYRAARELLINACRHACADLVYVRLDGEEGRVSVTVEDDGIGFDPEPGVPRDSTGFGLFSIRERINHMGGEMTVRSSPGYGATVILDVPIESRAGKS